MFTFFAKTLKVGICTAGLVKAYWVMRSANAVAAITQKVGAIAVVAALLMGAMISCKSSDGNRGEWPDVPSPTVAMEGQPQMMVGQRLAEIKQAVQAAAGATPPTATPQQMEQVTMLCDQVMGEQPGDPAARADAVHRAHMAATATPPDWAKVIEELTGG